MQIIRQPAVTPIAIIFAYYNLTKKHGLQKSLGGEVLLPDSWTSIHTVGHIKRIVTQNTYIRKCIINTSV